MIASLLPHVVAQVVPLFANAFGNAGQGGFNALFHRPKTADVNMGFGVLQQIGDLIFHVAQGILDVCFILSINPAECKVLFQQIVWYFFQWSEIGQRFR